jgi:hypothetical protein
MSTLLTTAPPGKVKGNREKAKGKPEEANATFGPVVWPSSLPLKGCSTVRREGSMRIFRSHCSFLLLGIAFLGKMP